MDHSAFSDGTEFSISPHGVATITIRSPHQSNHHADESSGPCPEPCDVETSGSASIAQTSSHTPETENALQSCETQVRQSGHTTSSDQRPCNGAATSVVHEQHTYTTLRSLFCALLDRLRESFFPHRPHDELPVSPEPSVPVESSHGPFEPSDEDHGNTGRPPNSQSLSIRSLNPATEAFHRTSESHNSNQDSPSSHTNEMSSRDTSDNAYDTERDQRAETPDATPMQNSNEPDMTPNPGSEHGPDFLIYVPRSVSPFTFGFLYDNDSHLAWPIIDQEASTPNSNEPPRTVHVIGFPFRVAFTFHPSEPEEGPDPERAADYVRGLERVDSDLRVRMSRFGIGDIGVDDFGGKEGATSGCGVCLEPYAKEDRPAWFSGQQTFENESVVAVPCPGFHTLHASCLRGWLSNTPPSKWVCPFCRASLSENKHSSHLLDFVRIKEREIGWRCDAPACLPYYDDEQATSHSLGAAGAKLVTMYPCWHEVHMECLCTTMSVEYPNVFEAENSDGHEEGSVVCFQASDDHQTMSSSRQTPPQKTEDLDKNDTMGKWVTCPACRKDAWAQLPVGRRLCRGTTEVAPP